VDLLNRRFNIERLPPVEFEERFNKCNMSNELGQVRLQVDLAVVETQLVADAIAADIDCARRDIEELGDLLGGLSLLDQAGDLELPRGEIHVDRGELGGEGGDDVPEIRLEDQDARPRHGIERAFFELFDVG
jgi:hypothetical protein